jgi:hypothetical protein
MTKSEIQQDSKEKEKPPPRMSRSFVERMSAPKHPSADNKKEPVRESTPVKVCMRVSLLIDQAFQELICDSGHINL